MPPSHCSKAPLLFICLSACGGASTTQQSLINPDNVTVEVTADVLRFQDEARDITLPNDNDPFGGFEIAETTTEDGETQFLAISQTDATFATLLVTDPGAAVVEGFYGRTAPIESYPSGRAVYAGEYIAYFNGTNGRNLGGPIRRDAEFAINFDRMTVAGIIDEGGANLFGLTDSEGEPLMFTFNYALLLDTATINPDGTFAGNITFVEEGSTITPGIGTFAGVFGGSEAGEVVGEVKVENRSIEGDDIIYGEVGVFAAKR